MSDYDNTNSGALFRNKKKSNDRQPDHKGSMETKCSHCGKNTEFWLSAWIRSTKRTGEKFFSLALTEKEEQTEKEPAKDLPSEFNDNEIPF